MKKLDGLPLSWNFTPEKQTSFQYIFLKPYKVQWIYSANINSYTQSFWEWFLKDQNFIIRGLRKEHLQRLLKVFPKGRFIQTGVEAIVYLQAQQRYQLLRHPLKAIEITHFLEEFQEPLNAFYHNYLQWRPIPLRFLFQTHFHGLRTFIAWEEQSHTIYGVVTLSRNAEKGWHVEQLLRHPATPPKTIDFLLSFIIQKLYKENALWLSLGEVPFKHLRSFHWLNRCYAWSRYLIPYRCEGLYRFKKKYAHDWMPLYLFCNQSALFPLLSIMAIRSKAILAFQKLKLCGEKTLWNSFLGSFQR